MSPDELRIHDEALEFAKANKKRIATELTDPTVFPPEEAAVSVFMAGSPGAGKTEASKVLVATFEAATPGSRILRIDPDEIRCLFPQYNGKNSWLLQGAVSSLVARVLDRAFEQRQSFLLDGTLSDYDRAWANIDRSLRRDRKVQILYVYQDPQLAWEFVQAREIEEGRYIPLDRFIEHYFAARDVVNRLKRELGPRIGVDLLIKPHSKGERLYRNGVDQIDYHIPEKYTREQLRELLVSGQAATQ